MKYDPSKTKSLILSYERAIRVLFNNFIKKSFPRLKELIGDGKQILKKRSTVKVELNITQDIEAVIDNYSYYEIGINLKNIVKKYQGLAYEKGGRHAWTKINGVLKPEKGATMDYFFVTPTDLEAINMLNTHSFRELSNATEYMKKELLRVISVGMLEGQGINKISREMRDRVNVSKHRADMITRTETLRSYNQAHMNQYKKVGIERWEWICAYDERTCDTCAGYDGKTFKIGDAQPPIHPSCRCSVAPYLEKD